MSYYCENCGHPNASTTYPKTCSNCKHVRWRNPVPVGVALVPVFDSRPKSSPLPGILVVQRAIPPKVGEFALPSGYMDYGETWEHCIAREVEEETGLVIREDKIEPYFIRTFEGLVLIFGRTEIIDLGPWLTEFKPNEEVSALDVIWKPTKLAFPLHMEAVTDFYKSPLSV